MNNILVIQTASIGDVILATAIPESLHRAFPAASIDFLLKKGNGQLLAGHPFLRKVLEWDKQQGKYSSLASLAGEIRSARYDLVVNLQRFLSSGLITVLSGAAETRGFSKNPLSFAFSRKIAHDIGLGLHETERNFALISDLPGVRPARPKLYPSPDDEAAVEPFAGGTFYTISPASLWPTKQFPAERWAELIDHAAPDSQVYLLGSPGDTALCETIARKSSHPGLTILAGRMTLLRSAALMMRARMNFANDSAPIHLASAVNAPVTAVFCSTVPAFGFGPLSDDSLVVQTSEPLPCRPCGLHGLRQCPEGHFRCAYGVDAGHLRARL